MSAARDQILGDIKRSLRGGASVPADQAAKLEQRLANHPAGLIPRRSAGLEVADVALHETVARVLAQHLQVAQVAGVSELVEVDDLLAGLRDGGDDEVRADEACAAGNEQHGA